VTVSSSALLADLQQQVRLLEVDLRDQVDRLPELEARLLSDHSDASRAQRTAESWTAWLDAQVTQAAVSWVLSCVFVRFCEDNDLNTQRWIAGIDDARGDGFARAVDAQAAWIQANPRENDRAWLRQAFSWLRGTRAGGSLCPDTDFVWWWDISADAAEALIGFFRRRTGDGRLVHRFDSPDWDTRFLGDLYQDLSETARKRYALLQTPEFVEEFILDLTLDPALDRFGLDGFRMIDPACGSGHFLLGSFKRLLAAWTEREPGLEARQRVQRALDSIHGVDINAGATAIAKFRLTVAALRAAQASGLDTADAPDFTLHIATGDSLIWGSDGGRQLHADLIDGELSIDDHRYAWEDIDHHAGILKRGSFHAVVANPPYITVKDRATNHAYRQIYKTCAGKYAMSVPFAELLFALAIRDQDAPGVIGQITSNSFMKREFGKKLIEDFFTGIDFTHVIDTSGAYIPGHATPTVILVGNRRNPRTETVRAVLGIRGEPSAPPEPAKGKVWRSIVENIDSPGTQTEYITVTDLARERLATHPLSLSGGGADDLKSQIEHGSNTLATVAESLGINCFTLEDDVFVLPADAHGRKGLTETRPMVLGDGIRDWGLSTPDLAVFPYDSDLRAIDPEALPVAEQRHLWTFKTNLSNNVMFGRVTKVDSGLRWTEFGRFTSSKLKTTLSITLAFVATHNHFVLDRGGKVFKQSAPVIKLPEGASKDDHLRLLGLLNSSTACFWLKQVSHNKGVGGIGGGIGDEDWEPRFEFTGTKLQAFPLPDGAPLDRAKRLDSLAQELASVTPSAVAARDVPTPEALSAAHERLETIRAEMIAVQEELDWEVYRLYGLIDDDLTYGREDLPGFVLGERAFEIILGRGAAAGEVDTQWFVRHRSTPITEIPAHWPPAYREVVARRIEVIESHPLLHLIERPECKRRWASHPWEDMQRDALTEWVLDRLEAADVWRDEHGPRVLSVAQLADLVRTDLDLRDVLVLLTGKPDLDLTAEMGRLLANEAVPYLAAHRYKESGMRKRAAWEHTWDLQRREDAGEEVGEIPVPPKYGSTCEFRRSTQHLG
jgi:hypothetical protein